MSRYTGPRLKVMRALGVDLPGLARKSMQERPQPPGQHGAAVSARAQLAQRCGGARRCEGAQRRAGSTTATPLR